MLIRAPRLRLTLALGLSLSLAAFAAQAGCGSEAGDDGSSSFVGQDGSTPFVDPPPPFGGDGSSGGDPGADADPDALGTLVVTPPTATVTVTIVDGVVTVNAPVTFKASYNGAAVTPQWLFDRGELGAVDANGAFKASGKHVGTGTVTARYGAREGTAKVTVVIDQKQNGAPPGGGGADAGAGSGGLGGVGGEPLGGAVAPAIVTRLRTDTNAPANAAELGFLYPYDKTVWPRGLLAPLVMWQTTHEGDAVYVKLSENGYTFEGTYLVSQLAAGSDARKRVRLEEGPWSIATGGNQGDDLRIDVKIYSAATDKVYGPITEKWKVAPGVLKGTVYYNSYDSSLTGGAGGGVIAIKPRSANPGLALPSQAGKCHVCHVVSADGSTLWAQDAVPAVPNDDYARGASYDLVTPANPRVVYDGITKPADDRKFVWAAPYPDGSFALTSSRYAREAYTQGDSKLFKRADGSELTSTTGLSGVVASAVTPAYAPDGRKIAFNYWSGTGANGVTAGGGHSIAAMDFACGAAAGSTKCAANPTYAFSGLRELYKNANTWPGWPSFLPDGKAVVFHNAVTPGQCGPKVNGVPTPDPKSIYNCQLTTWYGAKAELWWAADKATPDARALAAANGKSYLPTSASHPDDSLLNYEPTVNPVPSGGYYWVVFTARRMYGNLVTSAPWGANGNDQGGPIKKLWVAAIDENPAAGADPSHPAFYMPGQELAAGNTRGFWVVDPCKANGTSCESGDECCNGFCRNAGDGGALVCQDKPPGTTCSQEFEKCTVDADCCDPTQKCINGKCSLQSPVIK